MAIHPVFVQAFYYGLVILFSIFFVGLVFRGFFWKYLKVRTSFGKLVLVKKRTVLRDYFEVGRVEEGFLIFKFKKDEIRLRVNDSTVFYKCLAVTWVDLDEETNSLSKTNYSVVPGFDSQRYSNLLTRCLMRPSIHSSKEIIIIVLLVVILAGALVGAYFGFHADAVSQQLYKDLPGMIAGIKGQVVGGTSVI